MEYRFVGKSGLQVSELCLGTMMFGERLDEETSHRMLDRFTEVGGTFIDAADVYGYGRSEEVIGRWLQTKDRDDLVIATKVYGEAGPDLPVRGTGRKHLIRAVEDSLRRLGTDFIDLYQLHLWDDGTPLHETLATLDGLVTSGKVRFIGASNFLGWQLQKAIDLSVLHNWEPFISLQPLYNLLDRGPELELITVCLNEGLGVLPWSPLRFGLLSGKFRRGMDGPPAGARISDGSFQESDNEHTWNVIDVLHEVADDAGRSPAQVALNWLLQQPAVVAPIVGASRLEQLEDNLGATGWSLSPAQLELLDGVSFRPPQYPYDLQRLPRFRRRS